MPTKEEVDDMLHSYMSTAERELMAELLEMEDHEDDGMDDDCGESTTG